MAKNHNKILILGIVVAGVVLAAGLTIANQGTVLQFAPPAPFFAGKKVF